MLDGKETPTARLEANIQPANRSSIALVQKGGLVREGLPRRLLKVRGRSKDHERWALPRQNYLVR